MNSRKVLALGGLGALMPFLLDLMLLDPASALAGLSVPVVLGYGIRAAVFFVAGAVIVWLQKVVDARLAFQIGIAAPALFVGLVNTGELQSRTEILSRQSEALAAAAVDTTSSGPATGQGLDTVRLLLPDTTRDPGFVKNLLRGVTNRPTTTDTVVIRRRPDGQ